MMMSSPKSAQLSLSQWKDQVSFVNDNPQFKRGQISYLMRQRQLNGLDQFDAVKKVGRRLYIHEQRFAHWIESLNQGGLS